MSAYSFVKSTSSTTGTGNLTLDASVTAPYRTIDSLYSSYDYLPYYLKASDNTWERGWGQYIYTTGPTFARTVVLENSSGSMSAITLPSGTHEVYMAPPPVLPIYNSSYYGSLIGMVAMTSSDQSITDATTMGEVVWDSYVFDHFYDNTGTYRVTNNAAASDWELTIPAWATRFQILCGYSIDYASGSPTDDLVVALKVPKYTDGQPDQGFPDDTYVWQRPYLNGGRWRGLISTPILEKTEGTAENYSGLYITNNTGVTVAVESDITYPAAKSWIGIKIYE